MGFSTIKFVVHWLGEYTFYNLYRPWDMYIIGKLQLVRKGSLLPPTLIAIALITTVHVTILHT